MASSLAVAAQFAPATILAAALFTLAWIVLGRISPGFMLFGNRIEPYNGIAQPVSGLGLGRTALAMNCAFVLTGMLLALGIVGVLASLTSFSDTARIAIGSILLLSPLGTAMCGIFTLERMLPHALGFLLGMGAPVVGFFVLGWQLRPVPELSTLGSVLIGAALVTLGLLILWFKTFDPEASGRGIGIAGLVQRVLASEVLGVFAMLGWCVRDLGAR